MKKLFLSLFVAGALTFGLQSCGDDPCDDANCAPGEECVDGDCVSSTECDFCGTYTSEMRGNLSVYDTSGAELFDTIIDPNNPAVASTIIAQSGSNYTLEMDLTNLTGGIEVKPKVEGTYDASTKVLTFNNATYTYTIGNASLEFIINGTSDFSTTNAIDADIVLTSPANSATNTSGSLTITGTK